MEFEIKGAGVVLLGILLLVIVGVVAAEINSAKPVLRYVDAVME